MKQMKFFALVLTFLMGVSLTSCFDSGSSNSYDGTAFVTVHQSYLSNRDCRVHRLEQYLDMLCEIYQVLFGCEVYF